MKKQFSIPKNSIRAIVRSGFFALLALSLLPILVRAQTTQTLPISNPDTSAYPLVTLYMWPTNADGSFIGDLTTDQVHVLENDREVKVDSLNLLEPGMHVIVAVNEGTTLANFYAGKSRMDRMKEVLTAWAKTESITTLDDFSLINNTDVLQNQLSHPADWVQAIADYNPELRKATPSINSLSQATALVKGLPAADHKSRVILYITPLPDKTQLTGLQEQATAAAETNTRLFIWLVGPATYSSEDAAKTLQQIAASTGGSFFIYSGAETLPDLNSYFNPLSHEYQITYQTAIQKSGTYTLQVQVNQKTFESSSAKLSFDLKAEAPNPIFLSPPAEITLNWSQIGEKKTWQTVPNLYTLKYMLEFPDGHERAIKTARLFVDGKLVTEVTAAPFDEIKWDLSQFTETQTHVIQIFVEDVAGFSASTIKTPVLITVNPKPQTALQKFISGINPITAGIVGLLVLMGVGLLLYFRRNFLKRQGLIRERKVIDNDPVKQPVLVEQPDYPVSSAKETPPDWPKLPGGAKAPARLISLLAENAPRPTHKNYALPLQDTVFGSDPVRCDIVLTGPTISAVHAKVFTDAAKHFYVADCGSAAGTWMNYAPVSKQGTRLEHGDLINIGAFAFRFEEINPEGRPIQVMPYNREE
jgi:hypothetical protein